MNSYFTRIIFGISLCALTLPEPALAQSTLKVDIARNEIVIICNSASSEFGEKLFLSQMEGNGNLFLSATDETGKRILLNSRGKDLNFENQYTVFMDEETAELGGCHPMIASDRQRVIEEFLDLKLFLKYLGQNDPEANQIMDKSWCQPIIEIKLHGSFNAIIYRSQLKPKATSYDQCKNRFLNFVGFN